MLPYRHSSCKLMPLLSFWTGQRLMRQEMARAIQERRYAIKSDKPLEASLDNAPT